ncbi:uncharacterized protein [Argopecten irradians]|uniref:uncharacterized protein n=1 Tax=Argopecten irradians TaxID=31199 RepID=UPI0037188330
MDLINYMTVYTNGHTDTCACYPISVSAHPTHQPITTHPTQQPTTTHQTTVTVHPCQKIDTLISLAHNAYLLDNAAPCPDGGHSKAEATVVDLCNAPASVSWHKGYNVMDHCNDIPEFLEYRPSRHLRETYTMGTAWPGIFSLVTPRLSEIATERCDHPMEVVTVVLGARDQYTHMAETYYTIQW